MSHAPPTISWAGESLYLLPERAVWWPRRRTLFIADVHLGKDATFRVAGIPVPDGAARATLARLSHCVAAAAADRLIILGDLLHSRTGRTNDVFDAFHAWRSKHALLDITLVRGNHDASAGDPPASLDIRCVDADESLPPFRLLHAPPDDFATAPPLRRAPTPTAGSACICGHLHPAVVIRTPAGRRAFPCFYFTQSCALLPAFGDFTGAKPLQPGPGDRCYAVVENEIIALHNDSICATDSPAPRRRRV